MISVAVIAAISSCARGPEADLRSFERSFRQKTDFSAFTNAAFASLKLESSEDRSKAVEKLKALLPVSLGIAPPTVGLEENSDAGTKFVRVTYPNGLVQYEVVVQVPDTVVPSAMQAIEKGPPVRYLRISEGVYILRMNL